MLSSQLDLALATIYLPAGAAAPERFAAEELRAHLRRICGKEPPVREGPADSTAPAILLGRGLAEPRLPGFDWGRLQEDGVVVKTVGNALVLAGPTPRGTLYAVYQFLDQVLGCRWLTPTCTIIPERTTLEISELDIVYVPQFRYREPFFSVVWGDGDWLARNRANSSMGALEERHGGKFGYAGFAHTFYPLVPPEKYFDAHPEYYSELNGKRTHIDGQLCLTNEELLDVLCDNVRLKLQQEPGARIVSITQNDWNGWCTCAKCRAIDEAEGSPSGTMIRFVNQVAERLGPEFPHVYFDTFAYTYTVRPPKTIRPRENVIVRLCHITPCCDAHPMARCEQNRWFYEVLQGWSAIAPELFIWDYYNNFHQYFLPHPNIDAFAADLPLFADAGVTGVFIQGDAFPPKGSGDMAELRAWVLSRLLWNPRQDAWALTDEFLTLYYGPAAPHLREYLDLLHAPAREGGNHFHLYTDMTDAPCVAGDAVSRYHALFDRAERAVGDDPMLLDRVRAARLPIEYVTWKRDLRFEVQGDRYRPAGELGGRMRRFFEVAEAHGVGSLREGGVPQAEIKMQAEGYEIVTITRGELKAAVIPALGGRLVSLATGDTEWIHAGEPQQLDYPYAGGYEEYSEHRWRSAGCNENYRVERRSADELVLFAELRNKLTLRRTYRLEAGALRIISVIGNPTDERRIGCFRTMPEFAGPLDALTVRFQQRDGAWREAAPWRTSDAQSDSGWVEGVDKPWGACRLERGGRALTLRFQPEQMEKVLFDWERPLNLIRLGLYSEGFVLEPGESFSVEQVWSADL